MRLARATLVVMILAVPRFVGAQGTDPQQPPRPYRGLFAGTHGETSESLTFLGSVSGGYDTNVLAGNPGNPGTGGAPPTTGPTVSSPFSMASGTLAYTIGREGLTFGATGTVGATYYSSLSQDPLVPNDSAGLNTSIALTSRTQFVASATMSYQPYYGLPGEPTTTTPDSVPLLLPIGQSFSLDTGTNADIEDHLNLQGTVSLNHQLTRRLSANVNYGYLSSQTSSHQFDLSTETVGGGLSYVLAKGLSLRLGYGQSRGQYGFGTNVPSSTNRSFNGGVDFNRALSLTRRTKLSFSTGVSGISNVAAPGVNAQTQYYATGTASLVREIGHTWNASLNYSRSASFVEPFLEPVLSDALSLGTGGRLSRRISIQGSLGGTYGNVGVVTTGANHFRTYFGSSGIGIDISRSIQMGADYSYYWYRFGDAVALPSGLTPQSDRQSFRVYLSLWAPLMQRGRRPNATR